MRAAVSASVRRTRSTVARFEFMKEKRAGRGGFEDWRAQLMWMQSSIPLDEKANYLVADRDARRLIHAFVPLVAAANTPEATSERCVEGCRGVRILKIIEDKCG